MNSRAIALLGLLQTGFFLGGWSAVMLFARTHENNGWMDSPASYFRNHYWWLLVVPLIWTVLAAWWSATRGAGKVAFLVIMLSGPGIGVLFAFYCIRAVGGIVTCVL